MDQVIFFLKLHAIDIIFFVLLGGASVVLAFILRKNPEKLGFPKPVKPYYYLLCGIPLIIFAALMYEQNGGGVTNVDSLDVVGNAVLVRGYDITYRERVPDGIEEEIRTDKLILFDRQTGTERVTFSSMTPLYIQGDRLLTSGALGYHVIDINTGKVLEIVSEAQLKEKLARVTPENIFELSITPGEPFFRVRTVMDKSFTYDLLADEVNASGGYVPFGQSDQAPNLPLPQTNLFQPVLLGAVAERLVVLSYDDLERKHFILSALSPDGLIKWTKRDSEISGELAGEPFADNDKGILVRLSSDALYFSNGDYLGSVSLQDGRLVWLRDL
ncbi:MAG: hypothetical protein ACK5DD_03975 [Cyclobacteriaceae bacterium]|jgi:hypothetical protein